jgi:hypothetical protein
VGCPGQFTHTTIISHGPLDILQAQEQVRHRGGDRCAHRESNPGRGRNKSHDWPQQLDPQSLSSHFFFLIHVGCPGQLTRTTTIPHAPLDILQAQEQVRHRGGDRRAHRGSNPGGGTEQVHDGPQQLNPHVLGTHEGSNQGTQAVQNLPRPLSYKTPVSFFLPTFICPSRCCLCPCYWKSLHMNF